MTAKIASFARTLGADSAAHRAGQPYYANVDPDDLDDLLDDAWMMGATQDELVDAGFDVEGDPALRTAARAAFEEGFRQAFAKAASQPPPTVDETMDTWLAVVASHVELYREHLPRHASADDAEWTKVVGEHWGDLVLDLEDDGYTDDEDPQGLVRAALERALARAAGRSS